MDTNYLYTGWGAASLVSIPSALSYYEPCSCNPQQVFVSYVTSFDGMGRPISMSDTSPLSVNRYSTIWAQNAQYDVAGRLTSWQKRTGATYAAWCDCYSDNYETETRGYNVNGQMTSLAWNGSGIQYQYSASQNNGQIAYSGEADHDSGMMAITIPGHADHHRSEATLACFNDQSMIGISQSFPVF